MPPWYLFEKRHHITGWHQWHAFVPGSKDHCWNRTEVLTQASSLTDLTVSKTPSLVVMFFHQKLGSTFTKSKFLFKKKRCQPENTFLGTNIYSNFWKRKIIDSRVLFQEICQFPGGYSKTFRIRFLATFPDFQVCNLGKSPFCSFFGTSGGSNVANSRRNVWRRMGKMEMGGSDIRLFHWWSGEGMRDDDDDDDDDDDAWTYWRSSSKSQGLCSCHMRFFF